MKKCISLIICAVLLMTMAVPMAIPAGAMGNTSTLISQAGTNEYPAPDIATIEAGEAVMGELEAIKAPTLDGVISERAVRSTGVSRDWVLEQLKKAGIRDPRDVFFAQLTPDGTLFIQQRQTNGAQQTVLETEAKKHAV